MKLTIGSRGSRLALAQAEWVQNRLSAAGHELEITIIKTTGDRLSTAALSSSGTKGLFTKEIEEALLAGAIDLAVHSQKDLPTEMPGGLVIAAVPEREDPHDAMVSADNKKFEDLPQAARVATSSVRRQSQLLALRPDLQLINIRGNVDTRLRKLDEGDCHALVLAAAGLKRLGLASRITQAFSEQQLCPAPGQGALAIETRIDDHPVISVVKQIDDSATHRAVRAERAMLRALGGGCMVPISGFAKLAGNELCLVGVVASPSGDQIIRAETSGTVDDPEALGEKVAQELLNRGAQELLSTGERQ